MPIDLNQTWFLLAGILLTGYVILDGFDFGVGAWHLATRSDEQRRILINAIGPIWDGNEVWLVAAGGALFAAFPHVYATVFSGFYLAMMLVLFALIFRAASIEFRGQSASAAWRRTWDVCFSVASVAAALLLGVALGNIIIGLPLDARGEYTGSLMGLLRPYPLLVGMTAVALTMTHGATYLLLKTEGELQQQMRARARRSLSAFHICFVVTTVFTFVAAPHMLAHFRAQPALWLLPIAILLVMSAVPHALRLARDGRAFAASCLTIAGLMLLVGLGLYPNMVVAQDGVHHLTIYNAASSAATLRTMLIIAVIGLPLALLYTGCVHWIFRGKVKLDSSSY
ncbi:MAG: cytochrome d ubiquinol oxidase subunit II [Vicinamibacteria bacterium]|jgi:cytochrome d ubiquinol oxidase subunit II|nr:cytochrome d ubiquinol oxidase subunit II [Vicinamibacteria bacterium]